MELSKRRGDHLEQRWIVLSYLVLWDCSLQVLFPSCTFPLNSFFRTWLTVVRLFKPQQPCSRWLFLPKTKYDRLNRDVRSNEGCINKCMRTLLRPCTAPAMHRCAVQSMTLLIEDSRKACRGLRIPGKELLGKRRTWSKP